MDWTHWHKQYEISPVLRARLQAVCEQIRATLTEAPPGNIRIVSICAGDGRDVIESLRTHPRRDDVTAWLLDTDAPSLERARLAACAAGIEQRLRFVVADATLARNYRDIVPADVVIVSGVFGHQSNANIFDFLRTLPMLCRTGGCFIWNRHMVTNDGSQHAGEMRQVLQQLGFVEAYYEVTAPLGFAVGRHRFTAASQPLDQSRKLFEFVGLDRLAQQGAIPTAATAITAPADSLDLTIPDCFAEQVRRHPFRVALAAGAWQPTYETLHAATNHLAHELVAHGGGTGERIAVLMRHDSPLIAAVLAIVKAGRIAVVLNASDPPARLQQILDDADPRIIVSDSGRYPLATQLAGRARRVHCFEPQSAQKWPVVSAPEVAMTPADVAFLVYTSGSTARPKGVMRSHRGAIHQMQRITTALGIRAEDRIVQLASLSGGQGLGTTWCALLNGAALCPYLVTENGVARLADWMRERGITVYISSASLFRMFMKAVDSNQTFAPIHAVWLASEPATADDFALWKKHFPHTGRFVHMLSSSETGTIAQLTLTHADHVPAGRLPVGKPPAGVEIQLCDDRGNEVPTGETGEMIVRSDFLSPGYWRNEALTAERFHGSGPQRIFRSADLARRMPDGNLVFVGRKDARLKIRGYRIEPGEIEDALRRLPGVNAAVVCAQERSDGELELVAHVTFQPGARCTSEQLRANLTSVLPPHMLPTQFVFLDAMPLTPHGKVDREALRREPGAPLTPAPVASAPRIDKPVTATEVALAEIWSGAFSGRPVARCDNFFDLGGDSLLALLVAARVHAAWGIELAIRTFAQKPVLHQQAALIDELRDSAKSCDTVPLVPVSRDKPLPLSLDQERTWKYSELAASKVAYLVTGGLRLQGNLDVPLLIESLNYVIRRHEVLRTTFSVIDGKPMQVIHPPAPIDIPVHDFSTHANPLERADAFWQEELAQPVDLGRLPLLRFYIIRLGPDLHLLIRINHHLISDGWSWWLFYRELGLVYEAKLRGDPPPLPATEPLQFADFAAWQRRTVRSGQPAYEAAMKWWRSRLRNAPTGFELPCRRKTPLANAAIADSFQRWCVPESTSSLLDQLGRTENATFYIVRLAAFAALAAHETGQPDVVLGGHLTSRNRAETQQMFGFFSNLITLRLRGRGRLTFRKWLRVVRDTIGETQAHGEVPYEVICDVLRQESIEPPQIRMVIGLAERPVQAFAGLDVGPAVTRRPVMPWGCSLMFTPHPQNETFGVAFDAHLYDPAAVKELLNRFAAFLSAAAASPDAPLNKLLGKKWSWSNLRWTRFFLPVRGASAGR